MFCISAELRIVGAMLSKKCMAHEPIVASGNSCWEAESAAFVTVPHLWKIMGCKEAALVPWFVANGSSFSYFSCFSFRNSTSGLLESSDKRGGMFSKFASYFTTVYVSRKPRYTSCRWFCGAAENLLKTIWGVFIRKPRLMKNLCSRRT
jgi:hypothetical protein